MSEMKVISVRGHHLSRWLQYHDPLDIGRNNILYDDFMNIHPQCVGEKFGNYIGVISQIVSCGFAMDRTDSNLNYFNFHTDPIPKVEVGWNRNIEEVFLQRSEDIWAMDRPVRMWWSGGIDSTAALVALLRTKKPEHELIVYCGPPCKKENPYFWSLLEKMDDITFQFNNMETIFAFSPNFTDGSINITGEPGDPTWGSFVIQKHIHETDKHWSDVFDYDDTRNWKYPMYKFRNAENKVQNQFMEFCEYFNSKSPIEIRNPFDFIWWIAFATKWQWNEQSWFISALKNPSNYQNIIGFYNSPEIQKWSIHNHDLKHKGNWKSYKGPAKDFIYAYDGNEDYRDNKIKEASFKMTYPMAEEGGGDPREWYSAQFVNQLIMNDGSYHKELYTEPDYGVGYDPEINLYDKWDIYNKSVWDEWKKQL